VKRRKWHSPVRPSRTIGVNMCDKDALEPISRFRGLRVRIRGGRKITCIDGPTFRIETSGLRADLIVNKMIEFGLSHSKLEQWLRVVSQCETERAHLGHPRPAEAVVHPDSANTTDEPRYKGGLQNERLQEGEALALYSTGLFNGGGNSYCSKKYPVIQVAMCDKDALEPVGKWWGARVLPRGDRVKVCASGPAYRIAKGGSIARFIVDEMMQHGLSKRKKEQWHKVLIQCQSGASSVPR